ncbi:MAG TPA: hypothetical protein VH164_09865, partial [Ktedonobacteraceae bacterium]|nr:hypothetical protein [Ktedonobacteraceae bacterium]
SHAPKRRTTPDESHLFKDFQKKCPEISTIFALKHAHLPRIVDIGGFSFRNMARSARVPALDGCKFTGAGW